MVFFGGGEAKSIVMEISFVLIFLLLLDTIFFFGGGGKSL